MNLSSQFDEDGALYGSILVCYRYSPHALRETWANLGRDAKRTVSASFLTDMRAVQDLHSLSFTATRLP
jgi:hypothetical protein